MADKIGRTLTGGTRDVVYKKGEELEDSEHTQAFKEAYHEWQKNPHKFWWKRHWWGVALIVVAALIILIVVGVMTIRI